MSDQYICSTCEPMKRPHRSAQVSVDKLKISSVGLDALDDFITMARNRDTKRLVFEACDINQSGYIELEDLEYFSQEYLWSKQDVTEIFNLLDRDSDGKVSFNDFLDSNTSDQLLRKQNNLDSSTDTLLQSRESLLQSRESLSERRLSSELRVQPCHNCRKKRNKKSGNTWPRRILRRLSQQLDVVKDDTDVESKVPPRFRHSICNEISPFSAFTPGFCNDVGCNVVHLSPDSQEQVIELYQQIHTEHPHLLPGFEKIILDVIRDIRFHQQENERLELSYKREKDQHERHLRHLEEEMEAQMQKVEARVRKEERTRLETEKNELKAALEMEISEMRNNLHHVQKMEQQAAKQEMSDELAVSMRDRVEDLQSENRYMKSDLTDAQTNLALLRSELAQLRQQYEDKMRELTNEKSTLQDYVREQENLSRQLHLLHDANKRLHDTNDDLRAAVESQRSQFKREKAVMSNGVKPLELSAQQRGSVVGHYFDSSDLRRRVPSLNDDQIYESALSARNLRMIRQKSCDHESLPEDFDSGNSTLRDLNEFDSETEALDTWDGDSTSYDISRRSRSSRQDPDDTEINESLDEYDTEIELDLKRCISRSNSRSPQPSRSPSVSSRGSSNRSVRTKKRRQVQKAQDMLVKPVYGEPERMYKVVLAGDCAVGKSSFIMRLCKGKFMTSLNSTLGVDFQTKTVEVDGRIIALQLWDTAGQERFRSIAKSYFRRADGVLLLYDCTYERSFLNVREWLNAIEDGTDKKIPIMMVANKTDLREEAEEQGRRVVKEEDGNRLAKSFDGTFIETSAKDGSNVMEAVVELARRLRCNEDVEVQSAALHLHAETLSKSQRKSSTCCN